jgi:hypothetical protein
MREIRKMREMRKMGEMGKTWELILPAVVFVPLSPSLFVCLSHFPTLYY